MTGPPHSSAVPHSLVVGAAWSWRLLLVGVTVYAAVRVLVLLSMVVIPLVAALLLAALLRPVAQLLQRRLPGPLSALATLLLATVVLGSLGYLIGLRFTRELPSLIGQLVGTVRRLRAVLSAGGPGQLQLDQIGRYVRLHPLSIGLSFCGRHRARWNRRSDRRGAHRRRHSPGMAGDTRSRSGPSHQAKGSGRPMNHRGLVAARLVQQRRWRVVRGGDRVRRHIRGHPANCHDAVVSAAKRPCEHRPT
ncbi:MAG: hypothetical protein M3Y48_14340 [Actinomycetota bacterium]|nr:hypothetical protein [Actinomycetota bacterium]